jgi:hypothetical protein
MHARQAVAAAHGGKPKAPKKLVGIAINSAGVAEIHHGPCALLPTFHVSRTDTPRLRSSR